MRLINARTLELEYFPDHRTRPKYAILSHTWADDEVLYHDITSDLERYESKKGFLKIKLTCEEALRDGCQYAWVDTCCIDKTSSAELSEAVNSMFQWYQSSEICYAYLADVLSRDSLPADEDGRVQFHDEATRAARKHDREAMLASTLLPPQPGAFKASRWFSRGWTLQELISPCHIKFFDHSWTCIGSRAHLIQDLAKITGIPENVLQHPNLVTDCSVAMRMSWASKRQTTRIEDEAYCLLGIFGINMPLLYGEQANAFTRLQQEIIRQNSDQSIFAWEPRRVDRSLSHGLKPQYLAPSTANFATTGAYMPLDRSATRQPYAITNIGLELTAGVVYTYRAESAVASAVLDCFDSRRCTRRLAFTIWAANDTSPKHATEFIFGGFATFDAAYVEKIKVVRRITILNKNPKEFDRNLESRVRCFFMCEWKMYAPTIGGDISREELSMTIIGCYPNDTWNLERCTLMLNQGRISLFDSSVPLCAFATKLSYKPHKRRSLGSAPAELIVVIRLYCYGEDLIFASLTAGSEGALAHSLASTPGDDHFKARILTETGAEFPPLVTDCWNVRLAYMRTCTHDPYDTLSVIVSPKSTRRHHIEDTLAAVDLAKRKCLYTLTKHIKKHKTRSTSKEQITREPGLQGDNGAIPTFTLEELYGGRKRWREMRNNERLVSLGKHLDGTDIVDFSSDFGT